MQIYSGQALEKYKKEALRIDPSWNRRDFANRVENHLKARTVKILVVGGLRGTGKTIGILQAAEPFDALYVISQKDEAETGRDYIELLKRTEKKYVIIDEYGWIRDRRVLDEYLLTATQNGKRIVLTGAESISLEMLNYGALIHRADIVHTTMFPYEEYRKVYGLEHSPKVCDDYLTSGGIFREYVAANYDTMKEYIDSAIVRNLADYMKEEMDEERARTLTYAVLYKAICPSNLSNVPVLCDHKMELKSFLDTMGVNTGVVIEQKDLNRVEDIFIEIGVIVCIPNYYRDSSFKKQYYITNPSLTCQMIKAAYGLQDISDDILGHVFEAIVMTQLSAKKLTEHRLYFMNSSGHSGAQTKELDAVITDIEEEHAYFFEFKHTKNVRLESNEPMLSGYIEETYFPAADIDGRYVVYKGEPCVKEYTGGDVLFTPPSHILDDYFAFEAHSKNVKRIHTKQEEIEGGDSESAGGFSLKKAKEEKRR